ncbi:MAG: T9SS type A sorting domain-containing protein [Saprospiraceae bacterium]|nr:T9SS type A sorting domain-containing protein [Saprospiraceae bacterium]
MKYQLTFILVALFSLLQAQKNISVQISHVVDGADNPFVENTTYSSANNGTFSFDRFEYYLCNFKIIHDGGQELTVSNLYALINASKGNGAIDLGSYNVTDIEGIDFNVGVDSATNHLDPASYASDHPLAPQNPSMHWGWASGYRFIALEGLYDSDNNGSLDATTEYHAVGDQYFSPVNLILSSQAISENSNDVTLYIQFDLNQLLMNVQQGEQMHGSSPEISQMMDNIVNLPVFSADTTSLTSTVIGTPSVDQVWTIMPNPTTDILVVDYTSLDLGTKASLVLTDALGRVMLDKRINNQATSTHLDLEDYPNGYYYLSVHTDGIVLDTKKIQIQH